MLAKVFFLFAAFSGATGVILGAFAAHGLKGQIETRLLDAFQTGVQYQMIHALALLSVAIMLQVQASLSLERQAWFEYAGYGFLGGILLFSGSLYGLALLEWKWLGPVTPLGGLLFIAGWVALFIGGLKSFG